MQTPASSASSTGTPISLSAVQQLIAEREGDRARARDAASVWTDQALVYLRSLAVLTAELPDAALDPTDINALRRVVDSMPGHAAVAPLRRFLDGLPSQDEVARRQFAFVVTHAGLTRRSH